MWKEMADKGVAEVAEVISDGNVAVFAEVMSEGNVAVTGVVSLPSFGLFAAGMLAKDLRRRGAEEKSVIYGDSR